MKALVVGLSSAVVGVGLVRRWDVHEEDFEPFIERFMKQAEALWRDWPVAA